MNRGVLIFAQNSTQIDYAKLAILSAKFAHKHLNVPVSLVTDYSTVEWIDNSGLHLIVKDTFDKVILIERKKICENFRQLADGDNKDRVPFINDSRPLAYDLTPYDRTLLIDSDYFINSSLLNEYWNVDYDVMIGQKLCDIANFDRIGYHDRYISDTAPHLYWATTVMFTKNQYANHFFNLVKHIKNNYVYYADVYRFDYRMYRNDIAFSIAKHIINGYQTDSTGCLPPVFSSLDRDILVDVNKHRWVFLVNTMSGNRYYASSINNQDIHVMNKQSIIRNYDKLMDLV